jgi:two-component system chemotaxis response regulator CheY
MIKVLIVDDSPLIRRIIITALKSAGVEDIVIAEDGVKALETVMEREFDIILMDWNMPKMSGIDALRKIRKTGIRTPIIMVTTESERNNIIEAIKAGANNYVIKPFEPEKIVIKVMETMERFRDQ